MSQTEKREMPANVTTFCANLKRAIRDHESVKIGGGTFSPDELREVLDYLEFGSHSLEGDYFSTQEGGKNDA